CSAPTRIRRACSRASCRRRSRPARSSTSARSSRRTGCPRSSTSVASNPASSRRLGAHFGGGHNMLRIYGSARSRTVRVLWMVGELGLKYEQMDWLPRAPETRTPDYRKLNANGRVPTIDDDGFILSESMAINFYLAKKHKSALYPSDPKNEALALQWSLWETDRTDRQ